MTAKTWVLGVAAAGVVATSVVIGLATGPAPSPPETAKESAPALATAEEPKPAAQPAPAGGPAKWVTLKGRVVYPANRPLPEKKKIDAKSDREHCLSKGDLFADDVVVNPANRGIKNVWVYLRPDSDDPAARLGPAAVHPDLRAAKPVEHAVDQPCCQFVPRVLAVRAGDTIRFKNSSPIPHNVNYAADANPFNRTLPAGGQTTTVVEAQRGTIVFKCDIHPWMAGAVLAFDHPYFALTDADGNYEIKNAPTAGVRVVYRHEGGYHKGRDGAKGFPIAAPAAGGVVQLPPLAFEWPKP